MTITMRRAPLRLGVVLATVVALLLAVTPVADAKQGKPMIREKWSYEFGPEHDDFLSEACGIEVYVEGHGMGTFKMYEDGLIIDHYNAWTTHFSPETGEVLIRQEAATYRGRGVEVFDEATQILTVDFSDTFVGLPSKWTKPGEGVLLRDAGKATFTGTAVVDFSNPEEPQLISLEEEVDVRGPHPELEMDVLALICGALGG